MAHEEDGDDDDPGDDDPGDNDPGDDAYFMARRMATFLDPDAGLRCRFDGERPGGLARALPRRAKF